MADASILVIGALVVVLAVTAISRRTGIASPLILLVVGAGVAYLPGVPTVSIDPELVLVGVLPPLLYASAVNVHVTDLRRNIQAIAGLSVVLVLVSTAATGLILYAIFPELSLPAAFAVGAVVSPTDAVAATSIGKRLGLPDRLITVLEGESLVNDASALTLLRSAIAATAGAVTFWSVLGQFAYAVVVGIVVGGIVGWITVALRARLADPVLTTAISFIVPFVAYLPAERLGASGVLATVVAGLVTGYRGARVLAANQRVTEHTNWRTIQFILENAVFFAMGLQLRHLLEEAVRESTASHISPIEVLGLGALVVLVLLLLRLLYITVELPFFRRAERRNEDRRDRLDVMEQRLSDIDAAGPKQERRLRRFSRGIAQRRADLDFASNNGYNWRGGVVLGWAGMRGVVTLAAAQTLPIHGHGFDQYRAVLILIAFVVAVISLLVFGGTLPLIIRATGIQKAGTDTFRGDLRTLVSDVTTASLKMLDDPARTQINGQPADPRAVEMLRERYARFSEQPPEEPPVDERDVRSQFFVLQRRMRQAAREELLDASAIGTYNTRVVQAAQDLFDLDDTREDRIRGEF